MFNNKIVPSTVLDDAIKNDDFEVAQAFKDIKAAIEIVLLERMKDGM